MVADKDDSDAVFTQARNEIEGRPRQGKPPSAKDAEGAQTKPELVNKMATPGAGTLPEPEADEAEAATG